MYSLYLRGNVLPTPKSKCILTISERQCTSYTWEWMYYLIPYNEYTPYTWKWIYSTPYTGKWMYLGVNALPITKSKCTPHTWEWMYSWCIWTSSLQRLSIAVQALPFSTIRSISSSKDSWKYRYIIKTKNTPSSLVNNPSTVKTLLAFFWSIVRKRKFKIPARFK